MKSLFENLDRNTTVLSIPSTNIPISDAPLGCEHRKTELCNNFFIEIEIFK